MCILCKSNPTLRHTPGEVLTRVVRKHVQECSPLRVIWTQNPSSVLEIPLHIMAYHESGMQHNSGNMDESPKILSKESKREHMKYDSTYIKFKNGKTKNTDCLKIYTKVIIYKEKQENE